MICLECGHVMTLSYEPITTEYKGVEVTVDRVEHLRCCNPDCDGIAFSAKQCKAYSEVVMREYIRMMGGPW